MSNEHSNEGESFEGNSSQRNSKKGSASMTRQNSFNK